MYPLCKAVLVGVPLRELENSDDIVTTSLYNILAEDLIAEEIRDVETRVREMLKISNNPSS